tara:strand:- start:26 stop:571 length:546 start_codon:yes stop_codon:yes gene_type:complete
MTDYTKCCVYKLCCRDASVEEIYIGSTTNVIKRRSDHKKRCTNPIYNDHNQYKYQFIRDHGGWDNWNLVVVEEFSCTSKMEQTKVERSYVEKLKPQLNARVPANYQTGDVYDKKEYGKEYNKEYYEKHKNILQEKNKQYIECPCCGKMVQLVSRARHNKSKQHLANESATSSTTTPSESES